MDSAQLVVLVGAVGTLSAMLLQLAGRWPGGRPSFGPFQAGVLAVSLAGVALVYAGVFRVAAWELGQVGALVAIAACSVSVGATWERRYAISRWRWPWQHEHAADQR